MGWSELRLYFVGGNDILTEFDGVVTCWAQAVTYTGCPKIKMKLLTFLTQFLHVDYKIDPFAIGICSELEEGRRYSVYWQ